MKKYISTVLFILFVNLSMASVSLEIQNVDIDAGTLDIYMINEVEVIGFQFYLTGITITGVSGGTAEQYLDFVDFYQSTGKVVGASFGATVIPSGSDVLTSITFSSAEDEICFAEDVLHVTEMVVSNAAAQTIDADWGDCYCSGEYDVCGVCNGLGSVYECGCYDIEDIYNESTNVITISSVASWDNDFHYDFTYTLGELTYQTNWGAERRITGLSIFCYETGETWDFNSDSLRSGNRHHDYSELMERYENFTPPENRGETYAYIWAWDDDGTGNYHGIDFYGYGYENGGDYFQFYQGFDWLPLSWGYGEETFPDLKFEMGTYNNYIDYWGGFDFNFEDDWTYLENEEMTVGLSACNCEGNLVDMCGVCNGDGMANGTCDCEGNVFDSCGVCGGSGTYVDECGVCDGPGAIHEYGIII
jgi:hypothetical protein